MEQWNQPRGAQGGSYSSGQMGPTDPMVNAVGAAPAGNVSASSQQVGLSGPALMWVPRSGCGLGCACGVCLAAGAAFLAGVSGHLRAGLHW